MKKFFLCLSVLLLFIIFGISCNSSSIPLNPNTSDLVKSNAKPPAKTPTFTPTPVGEISVCLSSGDPGTAGTLITDPTALQGLGTPAYGQWFGSDATGDCQLVQSGAHYPGININSTGTFTIPQGDTVISGSFNAVGGATFNVSVNGNSLSSTGNGYASFDISAYLVPGTNTITVSTNFGNFVNPTFSPLNVCFGLNYKICANVLQQPSTPTTPPPSPTLTETWTPTVSPTPTITGTRTTTPSTTISATPTDTEIPTMTDTPTNTVSVSPSVSFTQTATPTTTSTSTPTSSPTATPQCSGIGYSVPFIHYFQDHTPWNVNLLDSSNYTIGHKGCFLTCFSMLSEVNPGALNIDLSGYQNAIDANGNITQVKVAAYLGLPGANIQYSPTSDDIGDALKQGEYVIAHVSSTTNAGHFVLVTGVVNNNGDCRFTIADPNSRVNHIYLDEYGTPLDIRTFGSNGNATPGH